jgi:hypothetical protein
MTSIYTCTDEYIQPYSTSIVPGATNIALCDGTFVGHFQTFYDPDIYLIMHAALTDGDQDDDASTDDGKSDDPAGQEDGAEAGDAPQDAAGCSTSSSWVGSALAALTLAGAMLLLRRRRRGDLVSR